MKFLTAWVLIQYRPTLSPRTPVRNVNPPLSGFLRFWTPMNQDDLSKWRTAYNSQKKGARARGIGWELTFEEWLEWWGNDIHRRGQGHDKLCMQRVGDVGPYALWNIRKGYPLENRRTCGKGRRHRNALRAAQQIQAAMDAAPADLYEPEEREENELGLVLNCQTW